MYTILEASMKTIYSVFPPASKIITHLGFDLAKITKYPVPQALTLDSTNATCVFQNTVVNVLPYVGLVCFSRKGCDEAYAVTLKADNYTISARPHWLFRREFMDSISVLGNWPKGRGKELNYDIFITAYIALLGPDNANLLEKAKHFIATQIAAHPTLLKLSA